MFTIDKEKFGSFVAQLRKEKGLMQKELAEKLCVSDKAVSKWERGLSIPDVTLLIPLAQTLGVTVTELLECRRIPNAEAMDPGQTEELVQRVIGMTAEDTQSLLGSKRKRGVRLLLCTLTGCLELWILSWLGIAWEEILVALGTIMGLMAGFGLYFCLFAREELPKYYDENRISAFSDGGMRMNLPGVYFNNRNWPHILRAGQLWAMIGLVAAPLTYFLLWLVLPGQWQVVRTMALLLLTLGGLFFPMIWAGRKYEFAPDQPRPTREKGHRWAWLLVCLLPLLWVIGIQIMTGAVGTSSGLRVGYTESTVGNVWTASYGYFDGRNSRTINGKATVLSGVVHTEEGELDVLVTDQEGNPVFFRENVGTDSFEVPISGKVRVTITAHKHRGGFTLQWE